MLFEAWGRFVHRHRRGVLVASGLLLALSILATQFGGKLASGGGFGSDLEAGRTANLISSELPVARATGASFDILFSSATLAVDDPAYRAAVDAALAPLRTDSRVVSIVTPYDGSQRAGNGLRSSDGHQALAVIGLRDREAVAKTQFASLRGEVRSGTLEVRATGQLAIQAAFDQTLAGDLQRAEYFSLPISLLLLLLVFGAVVAGALPVGVGLLAVVGGLGATLLLARVTDVSQYAINIISLIGLGVAIDYSLFVVSRFREHLAAGMNREDAVALTMATAGRAITFSGLTVAIGLAGMLFYRGTFLASMGAAGAIVVFIAVFYGLTFLPAVLSILGPNVDRLRIPLVSPRTAGTAGFWRTAAQAVMRRPWVVLLPSAALLILASTPFAHLRLANGDVDMLPPRLEARQGYDRLLKDFPAFTQTSFQLVVRYADGDPLTAARAGDLYDLSRRMAAVPGVVAVTGPLDIDPRLTRAQYVAYLSGPAPDRPPGMVQAVRAAVGHHIVVMDAVSGAAPEGDPARAIVHSLRALTAPGGEVLVTGTTAYDLDIIDFILRQTPAALAFVVVATYLLLFLLTGSVILPLKALVMNFLSLGASFGALVWVFQDGNLSGPLGFTAQSIDPSIPVLLFCIVFGLSMDYEVLLVSRIHEEYLRLGDNTAAVAEGLARSGRIITGAAGVMVAVFVAFGLAEVVLIKAVGLGLAVAVAIDATVVRILVVPAVMRLLGDLNWWAPAPLTRLYERLRIGEAGARAVPDSTLAEVAS